MTFTHQTSEVRMASENHTSVRCTQQYIGAPLSSSLFDLRRYNKHDSGDAAMWGEVGEFWGEFDPCWSNLANSSAYSAKSWPCFPIRREFVEVW